MVFDVKKIEKEPYAYHLMSEKALAFHEALEKQIVLNPETIQYYGFSIRPRRSISVDIDVDRRTGKIKAVLNPLRHTKDKAMIPLTDIQFCFDEIVKFFTVCNDFGYLINDTEE